MPPGGAVSWHASPPLAGSSQSARFPAAPSAPAAPGWPVAGRAAGWPAAAAGLARAGLGRADRAVRRGRPRGQEQQRAVRQERRVVLTLGRPGQPSGRPTLGWPGRDPPDAGLERAPIRTQRRHAGRQPAAVGRQPQPSQPRQRHVVVQGMERGQQAFFASGCPESPYARGGPQPVVITAALAARHAYLIASVPLPARAAARGGYRTRHQDSGPPAIWRLIPVSFFGCRPVAGGPAKQNRNIHCKMSSERCSGASHCKRDWTVGRVTMGSQPSPRRGPAGLGTSPQLWSGQPAMGAQPTCGTVVGQAVTGPGPAAVVRVLSEERHV